MKSHLKIVRIKTWAAMLGSGLLAACGGGGESGGAMDVTSTSVPLGSGNPTSASASSANNPTRSAGALALATHVETIATLLDLRSTASALREAVETSTEFDTAPVMLADGTEGALETSLEGNAVRRLSLSTASTQVQPQFVPFSQEGHSFSLPVGTLLRYGDPASNRWVTKVAAATAYGECTNIFFRNDPAAGQPKVCQAWATTAETIASAIGPILLRSAGNMPSVDVSQIPTPWIGFTTVRLQSTSEVAPPSDIGSFRTVCGVAKLSFDDPIVYPGQVGKSHLHTFFGNTGVDSNSTPNSLRTTGASTCRGGIANRSAYWVPSMIDTRTGTPIVPTGNGVYYKTGYDLPTSSIHPIPAGLRMIAGTAGATAPNAGGFRFRCSGGPNGENDRYGSEIANCDAGASLIQEIFFPQCWDGVNLDSPDHKSHMAYPNNFKCPADHPVAIPAITFNVEYVVAKKDDPLHWRLSSDNYDPKLPGGYSSHGDWFNGWQSDISDAWAKGCVQAVRDCHSHLVGDGRMMY